MSTQRYLVTRGAALAALAASAVALAGCGNTAAPPTATPAAPPTSMSGAHNQPDVSFVQQMIPHHQQAVAMAKLATTRASSPQVKDLAGRIEAAQQPEIDQMNGLLRTWNVPDPMGGMNHDPDSSGGHPMDSMPNISMPGMMSDASMGQLAQASGPAFDTMFLRMMVEHHQGAVSMSQTELANGQDPDAKTLARNIITAQQREITEMHTLLGT